MNARLNFEKPFLQKKKNINIFYSRQKFGRFVNVLVECSLHVGEFRCFYGFLAGDFFRTVSPVEFSRVPKDRTRHNAFTCIPSPFKSNTRVENFVLNFARERRVFSAVLRVANDVRLRVKPRATFVFIRTVRTNKNCFNAS